MTKKEGKIWQLFLPGERKFLKKVSPFESSCGIITKQPSRNGAARRGKMDRRGWKMELSSAERGYHVTRISADSYDDQAPTGWIRDPYPEEAIPFHGVTRFLIRREELLDRLNFPSPLPSAAACPSPSRPRG